MNTRHKAAQAEALLNNEVFKEALSSAEASLTAEWKACTNREQRDIYWYKVNSLFTVIESLLAMVHNAKIEEPSKE